MKTTRMSKEAVLKQKSTVLSNESKVCLTALKSSTSTMFLLGECHHSCGILVGELHKILDITYSLSTSTRVHIVDVFKMEVES